MELDGVYLRTLTSKQGEVKIAHAADNVLTEYRLPSDFDENHERLTAAIHKLNLTKTNTKDDFEKIQSRIDIQIGFVRFVGLALVIVFIAMLNRYNIIPLLYIFLTIFATTILVTVLKYFHFAASMQFEILKRTKAIDHKIK
ncbi:MAG: hypothetical protein MZU97_14985 [Bacillus subtilis]|nr:hypothetical protein [Bacillus subtilis]